MIGKKELQPKLLYNINLEDLVPGDNFYRALEKILDLNFIYKECEFLYGKSGNKSIDPVVFFKANLFGFFEDIVSDRELIRRMSDSLAARLYIGYDIDEELPWHSTISRTRVLIPEKLFEEIFNKALKMCADAGLIEGNHQSVDSTLVKANASLEKVERKIPKLTLGKYIEEIKRENKIDSSEQIEEENKFSETPDRTEQTSQLKEEKYSKEENKKDTDKFVKGKEGLSGGKDQLRLIKPTKEKRRSLSNANYKSMTDPDSRIAKKPGKPVDLYYSVHYAVDSRAKIITDVLSSYADKSDSGTLMEIVNRTERRLNDLGLKIESVGADKNYCSGENLRKLEQKEIQPYIPTQKHPNTTGGIDKKEFTYDESKDQYICPAGKELKYKYTTKKKAKVYYVDNKECLSCTLREKCTKGKKLRRIQHSVFIKEYKRLSERMNSHNGKQKMRVRKTTTEPLFAEAKSNHGLSKFMTIGLANSQKKAFCIATVQNLKRLVKYLRRKANESIFPTGDVDSHFQKQISHFKEFIEFIISTFFFESTIVHEKN